MSTRRSWGRRVVVAAACLLAGVVSSVLVAWGGLLWGPMGATPREVEKEWPRPVREGWPSRPDVVNRTDYVFARGYVSNATRPGVASGMEPRWTQQVMGAGWPLCALEWEMWGEMTGGRITAHEWIGRWEVSDRVPVFGEVGARRMLPMRPMWAGMVVDAGVWGVVWYGLGLAPFVLRGWLRRRRGACVGCGYDLRGLGEGVKCPECGRAPS